MANICLTVRLTNQAEIHIYESAIVIR